jgi:hypothetical protein
MQGLCMASSSLRDVRAAATEALRLLPPGGRADTFMVDLVKACDHLAAAVADIPNELWAILLNTTAGAAEVRARLAELRKAA